MKMQNDEKHERIAKETEAYLAAGGVIEVLKPGPYPDNHPCKSVNYTPKDLSESGYFDKFLYAYKSGL